MPNQSTLNMNKIIIIISLFFTSCGTKTEPQVQAEQIQQQARSEMNALPVILVEIETGLNTDTLCLN